MFYQLDRFWSTVARSFLFSFKNHNLVQIQRQNHLFKLFHSNWNSITRRKVMNGVYFTTFTLILSSEKIDSLSHRIGTQNGNEVIRVVIGINQHVKNQIEYNVLQVIILQRIVSILKSEWKSSIFFKERKRKCVQFTARTSTCYWSMGSWGHHHQWVMDQHGMTGLSLCVHTFKQINPRACECVLSCIVSSSTRKKKNTKNHCANNNQHNQESGIVTITNYIVEYTLVCATMWIKYLQMKWEETTTKNAQHKAKHFNGI